MVVIVFVTGQISLVGKPEGLGRRLTKGNVYLDGSPICDDGWSLEDATVACRFNQPFVLITFSRMLGYGIAIPEWGSHYGLAEVRDRFQFTEISCNGDERNLLDCPLK